MCRKIVCVLHRRRNSSYSMGMRRRPPNDDADAPVSGAPAQCRRGTLSAQRFRTESSTFRQLRVAFLPILERGDANDSPNVRRLRIQSYSAEVRGCKRMPGMAFGQRNLPCSVRQSSCPSREVIWTGALTGQKGGAEDPEPPAGRKASAARSRSPLERRLRPAP